MPSEKDSEATRLARATFRARATGYDDESPWMTAERLVQPLVRPVEGGTRLMDVCAGTGAVSLAARRAGWRVTAVDASPEMVAAGRSKDTAIEWVVGDAHLRQWSDPVDVITCRQGLHYLDAAAALRRWTAIATFEVRIGQITTWSEDSVEAWEDFFGIASPGRRIVFAPGQIERAAHRLGLTVVGTEVTESTETLAKGLDHLRRPSREHARLRFESIAARFPAHHAQLRDGLDWHYRVRWEFISLRGGGTDGRRRSSV